MRDQLMQPDAVRAFIAAYHQEINAGRDAATVERGRLEKELRTTTAKLEGLYEAVADGLRTPGLLGKIEVLEQRKTELEAGLEAPPPSPVRLHPNLAELYRQKVTALAAALADPLIRDEAIALLRGLIDEVRLGYGEDGWSAELQGEITALVGLGMENGKAPRPGLRVEALPKWLRGRVTSVICRSSPPSSWHPFLDPNRLDSFRKTTLADCKVSVHFVPISAPPYSERQSLYGGSLR